MTLPAPAELLPIATSTWRAIMCGQQRPVSRQVAMLDLSYWATFGCRPSLRSLAQRWGWRTKGSEQPAIFRVRTLVKRHWPHDNRTPDVVPDTIAAPEPHAKKKSAPTDPPPAPIIRKVVAPSRRRSATLGLVTDAGARGMLSSELQVALGCSFAELLVVTNALLQDLRIGRKVLDYEDEPRFWLHGQRREVSKISDATIAERAAWVVGELQRRGPLLRVELHEAVGMDASQLAPSIAQLHQAGAICKSGKPWRWALPHHAPVQRARPAPRQEAAPGPRVTREEALPQPPTTEPEQRRHDVADVIKLSKDEGILVPDIRRRTGQTDVTYALRLFRLAGLVRREGRGRQSRYFWVG